MPVEVDVFVCGGGPVGLLVSYQLARLGLSTYVVEQFDKTQQAMYGRASTLYPRTIEMLDQLDLADTMNQIGFIGRGSATFKDGKRIHGRGWDFISRMHDTYFNYCLNIRQKYSENVFRDGFEAAGGKVIAGAKLKDFSIDDSVDDYKVRIQVEDAQGRPVEVAAKYIVGADGGRSSVRHIAGIPFVGERTSHHWVRIDAVIETDMPDARIGFGAIESPNHGNILVVALDHGRTRIGFALTQELYDTYGESISEDVVIAEAVKAFAPFSLKFVQVDWWTLYGIGQRVAERFQDRERILLAGMSEIHFLGVDSANKYLHRRCGAHALFGRRSRHEHGYARRGESRVETRRSAQGAVQAVRARNILSRTTQQRRAPHQSRQAGGVSHLGQDPKGVHRHECGPKPCSRRPARIGLAIHHRTRSALHGRRRAEPVDEHRVRQTRPPGSGRGGQEARKQSINASIRAHQERRQVLDRGVCGISGRDQGFAARIAILSRWRKQLHQASGTGVQSPDHRRWSWTPA